MAFNHLITLIGDWAHAEGLRTKFTKPLWHSVGISNYRKFPKHLWCSLEPSKTTSFHRFSVNFVIEILAPFNSHLLSRIIFHLALQRMNFRQLSSLKKAIQKKIFAIQKQFSHWNRFLIISKIYNLVILNEAQRSEESLHKAKYFKITSSRLYNFTISPDGVDF